MFKSSKIFVSFWEFIFFYIFINILVDEGVFGVYEIEFVRESGLGFGNGGGVGKYVVRGIVSKL